MTSENKERLLQLLQRHKELGISQQIDYEKFYLYSIIAHSTAIEGSTVTEIEAQLLFDEGITSSKRTMMEQLMNLDLKAAYEYGMQWIKQHEAITVDWLITLSSKVMAHTGGEYSAMGGNFSAAKGELRMLNVSAGLGGPSYMAYQKVPSRLAAFCEELNRRRSELRVKLASTLTSLDGGRPEVNARRKAISPTDIAAIYDFSFWAHYELVTIHPWADGNGRTSRLLMNLLQWEFQVLPTKVLKDDKIAYIKALADTRENEDINIFLDCMADLHIQHLVRDIDLYVKSVEGESLSKWPVSGQKGNLKWPERHSAKEDGTMDGTMALRIIEVLQAEPSITMDNLSQRLGIARRTLVRYMNKLQEENRIKRVGGRRYGYWEIINQQ